MQLLYAYSDSGIVVSKYVMDGENSTSVKEIIYCYITYASLADGIQETDLTPIYIEKTGTFN